MHQNVIQFKNPEDACRSHKADFVFTDGTVFEYTQKKGKLRCLK